MKKEKRKRKHHNKVWVQPKYQMERADGTIYKGAREQRRKTFDESYVSTGSVLIGGARGGPSPGGGGASVAMGIDPFSELATDVGADTGAVAADANDAPQIHSWTTIVASCGSLGILPKATALINVLGARKRLGWRNTLGQIDLL